MTDLDLLSEEVKIRTDIAEGLRVRMAKQDNGVKLQPIEIRTSPLERLRKYLAAHEKREQAA